MASVRVEIELDEFSDDDIREEYAARFEKRSKRGDGVETYVEKALFALRARKIDDCLYYLSMHLGRDFASLPDAVARSLKLGSRASASPPQTPNARHI
jgi:hypothetical protein